MKRLLLICVVLLVASPCWADDYYVSETGTGDGLSFANPDSIADWNAGVFGELDGDRTFLRGILLTAPNTYDGGADGDNRVTIASCETQYGASDDDPVSVETAAAHTDGFIVDVNFVTVDGVDVGNAGNRGITVTGDNVTIQNCRIVDWGQDGDGLRSGIYFDSSNNFSAYNNHIYTTALINSERGIRGGDGASTGSVISGNVIGQNGNLPVAIYGLEAFGSATIQKNIVMATEKGILYEDADDVTICHNIVIMLGSTGIDYGIRARAVGVDDLTLTVINNTVYDSGASEYGFATDDSAPENFNAVDARNNIFVGFGTYAIYVEGSITPTETNNDLYNNTANVYYNGGAQSTGTGTITTDPLFITAGSNFHLQPTSPCIDTGDNSVWSGTADVEDIVGYSITDGAGAIDAQGGIVDMGACESVPATLQFVIQ